MEFLDWSNQKRTEIKTPVVDNPPNWYTAPEVPEVTIGKVLYPGGAGATQVFAGRIGNENCAVKINEPSAKADYVQEEADLLSRLNKAAREYTTKTGESAQFFPRARLATHQGRKVLLVEWLPDDLALFDHLTRIRTKEGLGQFEVAYLEALRQALNMVTILEQQGVWMADRKLSDFLWKNGQLKVRDWNAQWSGLSPRPEDQIINSRNLGQLQSCFYGLAGRSLTDQPITNINQLQAAGLLTEGATLLLMNLDNRAFGGHPDQLSLASLKQRTAKLIGYRRLADKQKEGSVKRLLKDDPNEAYIVADMIADPKVKIRLIKQITQNGRSLSPLETIKQAIRAAEEAARREEAAREASLSPRERETRSLIEESQLALKRLRGDPPRLFPLPESVLIMRAHLRAEPNAVLCDKPVKEFLHGNYAICEAICEAALKWEKLPDLSRPLLTIFREVSHFLNFAIESRLVSMENWAKYTSFQEARSDVSKYLQRAALGYLEPQGYSELVRIFKNAGIWDLANSLKKQDPERVRWERFRRCLQLCGKLGVSPLTAFPQEANAPFLTPEWEIEVLQDTLKRIENKTHPLHNYPTLTAELRFRINSRLRRLLLKTSIPRFWPED